MDDAGGAGDLALEADFACLWIGVIGGIGGGAGLACFYAALARGTMSIVSPITACSAIVPLGLALGTGERPPVLALAGSAVALAGAVLASIEERTAGDAGRRKEVREAVLSARAAVGARRQADDRTADRGLCVRDG